MTAAPDDKPRDWETLRSDAIKAVREALEDAEVIGDLAAEVTDAVLSVIDEEATRRYCDKLIEDTHLKAMDFRNGGVMELRAAEDAVLGWVGAARALCDGAPNYAESVMEFGLPGGQRYAFTVQKIGKLSPHQARMAAEAERDELQKELDMLRDNACGGSL